MAKTKKPIEPTPEDPALIGAETEEDLTPTVEDGSELEDLTPLEVQATRQPEPRLPLARPSGPSFGQRLGGFFAFLVKLLLLLVLLAAIAAGVYFGWPFVYNQYVRPVQENTIRQAELEIRQEQERSRLAALETQTAGQMTEQAALLAGQSALQGQQQAEGLRIAAQETRLSAQSSSLTNLEATQAALQSTNLELKTDLERQVKLLRALELLSRARLYLTQSNFGTARQDVQSARDLLAEVQPGAPEPLGKQLLEVLQRLDLGLARLPDYPVTASDDLDIAWQVLMQGIPPILPATAAPIQSSIPAATQTPLPAAPSPTPESTLQPAPSATSQATLQAVPSPILSATP